MAGIDKTKDQSYFLYLLGQEQLSRAIFPLGELTKKEVRALAKKFGLPTANKPDSSGICFIGEVRVREFLLQKIKLTHGDIVSVDGKLLGSHTGLPFYTIGQREGLGISASVPYYVVDKNMATNSLIVAPFGNESLFRDKFVAIKTHWVANKEPTFPLEAEVKLRYRAENIAATIKKLDSKGRIEALLKEKMRAVTPGQAAVFYEGEKIIGGAAVRDSL